MHLLEIFFRHIIFLPLVFLKKNDTSPQASI